MLTLIECDIIVTKYMY